jgi:hypothetical protein
MPESSYQHIPGTVSHRTLWVQFIIIIISRKFHVAFVKEHFQRHLHMWIIIASLHFCFLLWPPREFTLISDNYNDAFQLTLILLLLSSSRAALYTFM